MIITKDMSKRLFTTNELKGLGFTQEQEAGFTYLWLETTRGVKLATPDYEDTGMDIADDEFHRIYIFGEDNQLTFKQIESLIAGEQ